MPFHLTNQASRYYQFTKHFLQYFNLLSSLSRSTFVGQTTKGPNATSVHISGISEIKKIEISHKAWDNFKTELKNSKDKEISIQCILEAHKDAYHHALRSKKDLWEQFLEYNLIDNGKAVHPIPSDAAIIQYYQKHNALFERDSEKKYENVSEESALTDYLSSKKQWIKQGIWKLTPEQMQVFKLQDISQSYSDVELEKRISLQKLANAQHKWKIWKNRNGLTKSLLTKVDHTELNQFQAFPRLFEPRSIVNDQVTLLKNEKRRLLRFKRRKSARAKSARKAFIANQIEKKKASKLESS